MSTWLCWGIVPKNVLKISYNAFYGCTGITSIVIPESVTTIYDGAFVDCSALTRLVVSENNRVYASIDGNLLSRDKKEFLRCLDGAVGEFMVPKSVTSIGDSAFFWLQGIDLYYTFRKRYFNREHGF